MRRFLMGNMDLAKRHAQVAMALSNDRTIEARSAIALGLAGDSAGATRISADLTSRFPDDTLEFEYLPMIRAATALRTGEPGKAIEALAVAAPYEMSLSMNLYPIYQRGEAYLAARQGAAAAAEFQKIRSHPGVVLNRPIGALAYLGLARSYVLDGDDAKARTAYQDFFALWKDADPESQSVVLKRALVFLVPPRTERMRGESPAEQDLDLRPVTFLASRGQTLLGLAATEAQHQIGGFEGHHGWLIERQICHQKD